MGIYLEISSIASSRFSFSKKGSTLGLSGRMFLLSTTLGVMWGKMTGRKCRTKTKGFNETVFWSDPESPMIRSCDFFLLLCCAVLPSPKYAPCSGTILSKRGPSLVYLAMLLRLFDLLCRQPCKSDHAMRCRIYFWIFLLTV